MWGAKALTGFTLLELLAVMAVICILAAELMAGFSRVEAKSRSTLCKSNLRQFGIALRVYLDAFGGLYPYVSSLPEANSRGTSHWFDALAQEIPDAKWGEGIFKCPAYTGLFYEGETRANSRGDLMAVYSACGSYAYNALGRRLPATTPAGLMSAGLGFTIYGGRPVERPVREANVRAPAQLYAFGDAPLSIATWGRVPTPMLAGAPDYNMLMADNASLDRAQHSAGFNMLLADMHVESVRINVLLDTNVAYRSQWNHDNLP